MKKTILAIIIICALMLSGCEIGAGKATGSCPSGTTYDLIDAHKCFTYCQSAPNCFPKITFTQISCGMKYSSRESPAKCWSEGEAVCATLGSGCKATSMTTSGNMCTVECAKPGIKCNCISIKTATPQPGSGYKRPVYTQPVQYPAAQPTDTLGYVPPITYEPGITEQQREPLGYVYKTPVSEQPKPTPVTPPPGMGYVVPPAPISGTKPMYPPRS